MPDIYAETVRKLNDYITSRLTGSDDSCKRIFRDTNPSKFIIVGSLANIIEDSGVKKSSVQENSITLKYKTNNTRPINIHIFYSIYAEDNLTEEEIKEYPKINKAWNRIDYEDEISLNPTCENHTLQFDKEAKEKGYDATVSTAIDNIDDTNQISIRIQNDSISKYPDRYLFNVRIKIEINKNELIPYHYIYYYEKIKHSFDHDFRSINCTAHFNEDYTQLTTSPIPTHSQIKEKLKTTDRCFEFRFDQLASAICLSNLEKYSIILDEYLNEYRSLDVPEKKQEEFNIALHSFKTICDDFKNGLLTLKNNENALKAFQLMNKTFLESSKHHHTWRIFQIIFIVSSIPKIILDKGSNTCDVIHIPTGGGKTEAYLGTSVFLMFYSRLIGKIAGNIAIIKFPLRMLSIQQIERVATKVIFAEKIRKEEHIGG